jgi:hypothetical protein
MFPTGFPVPKIVLCACAVALFSACGVVTAVAPDPPRTSAQTQPSLLSQTSTDFKAVIEALFFGTGPMARLDSPGCDNMLQRMRGWARGSRVRVVAYASIDAERRAAVQQTLQQASDAFASTLTTIYQTRDDASEPEGTPDSEIGVFAVAAPRAPELCGSSATNCQVVRYSSGVYIGSRVILSMPFAAASSGIVSHELGHAFGLCHIDPTRAGLDPRLSIMGDSTAGRWTPVDIEAFRLVYGAGLSPADSRQRFVSAGLIN